MMDAHQGSPTEACKNSKICCTKLTGVNEVPRPALVNSLIFSVKTCEVPKPSFPNSLIFSSIIVGAVIPM